MRWILVTVLLMCVGGCVGPHYAQINDVVLPGALNSGYQVIAVDDAAANRGHKHVSTAAPQVLVEPGTHKLTIESKDKSVRKDFTATIAPDKQYRITLDDAGEPKLVEAY
jgi:hypothetical protein